MKQTLKKIQALQTLTQQVDQLRRDRRMLAVDVRNQQRVCEEKKRRSQQVHVQRLDAAKHADQTQMGIQKAEQEIERLNVQLNTTRHQKEYDAIQHSMLSHRADIQKCEDEGLEALTAVDDLARQEEVLTEEMGQAEKELEGIARRVSEREEVLDARIAQLEAERDEARSQVNPVVLAAYERLLTRTRSRPLAPVKQRICQGCFTRITKQTENLLMRGQEVAYCHSCGRMLMLGDEEDD